jgi:cephalosporin hydroxylase
MEQDPIDALMIQEMLWRVKPDVVIELGTNAGGGALYFASILSLISSHGRVITIDPRGARGQDCHRLSHSRAVLGHWMQIRKTCTAVGSSPCVKKEQCRFYAFYIIVFADFHDPWTPGSTCSDEDQCILPDTKALWAERVVAIQGIPTDEPILARVRTLLKEWNATTVLVSEDSNHEYDVVLENAHAYAPFVTIGSYLLIQDTKLTRFKKQRACENAATAEDLDSCWENIKIKPGDSVHSFLKEDNDFIIDRSLEQLIYTQHAEGFLKRVR